MSTKPLVAKVLAYRSQWKKDELVKQALITFNGLKPEEADAVIAEANAQTTAVAVAEPVAPNPPVVNTSAPASVTAQEPALIQPDINDESTPLRRKILINHAQEYLRAGKDHETVIWKLMDNYNASTSEAERAVEAAQATSSVPPCNVPHPYPSGLAPLVNSGVAKFKLNHWFVNRCSRCGQFKNTCCGQVSLVSAVRDDGTLTGYGRQAAGLDPIKPPKPPKSQEQIRQEKIADMQQQPWWNEFRGVGELQGDGTIKMFIENFLPEGVALLCGLYKEGKSFIALSIAKALTSGRSLFERPGYEVPEIIPVLYLAAESGDSELKMRCKKFGITEDKTLFITRTLSKGLMLGLDDVNLESLVKAMKPVVILETLIRFSDGDEDDASDNRKLAHQIFRLIALGARAVVVIHHSIKAINKSNPTKSEAARGSGDILAMADVIWLAMQDDRLYQGGKGPNEIDVVGWGRDFCPVPMRLALTGKAPENLPPDTRLYAPGIVSYIDTQGNLKWVDGLAIQTQRQELSQMVEQLVLETPSITKPELAEKTGMSEWDVRNILKRLGYHRSPGGKKGVSQWTKKVT